MQCKMGWRRGEEVICLVPTDANTPVAENEEVGDGSVGRKRNGFREAELVIVSACSPTRFLHPALESANRPPGFCV
jgi:hypothetical protein